MNERIESWARIGCRCARSRPFPSAPVNYTDKIVRMTGEYQEYTDEQTGELYHSCVIYDALACCQQGVEFVLTDGDYPEEGTTITVVGRYETYTTPYYDYFHLVDGVREK